MSIRKGSSLWQWYNFVSCQYSLATLIWMGNGSSKRLCRIMLVRHNYRNPIRKTMLQIGQTIFDAVWSYDRLTRIFRGCFEAFEKAQNT